MNKEKAYKGIICVLRWTARIIAVGFVVLFLIFFIGEGGPGELMYLNAADKLGLTFMPVIFIMGLAVAWKRELLGGTIMALSVIGFNLIRIIARQEFSGEVEFAVLLIPSMIFMLLPCLLGRRNGA